MERFIAWTGATQKTQFPAGVWMWNGADDLAVLLQSAAYLLECAPWIGQVFQGFGANYQVQYRGTDWQKLRVSTDDLSSGVFFGFLGVPRIDVKSNWILTQMPKKEPGPATDIQYNGFVLFCIESCEPREGPLPVPVEDGFNAEHVVSSDCPVVSLLLDVVLLHLGAQNADASCRSAQQPLSSESSISSSLHLRHRFLFAWSLCGSHFSDRL